MMAAENTQNMSDAFISLYEKHHSEAPAITEKASKFKLSLGRK